MIRKTYRRLLLATLIAVSITGCRKDNNSLQENENKQIDAQKIENSSEEMQEENDEDSVNASESEEDIESQELDQYSFIDSTGSTLVTRIKTPEGYSRITCDDNSFGDFLRNFTLKEDGSPVLLYDGSEKGNQSSHVAVFDMNISDKDLQQCADSIIRMYAEYYYANQQYDKIKFHFVSGFLCEYEKWRDGYRVKVSGNNVSWQKTKQYDDSYETFEKYLDTVFSYASTLSLDQESAKINIEDLQIGDVFLKGGSPGHVVMVVDICENEQGEKAFLLAQGYMPAQEFHVLNNPASDTDPWYYVNEVEYPFRTSEYSFDEGSLKRLDY
ncbi:DUF4846 domain-containing protein [Anaerosporobacter sp.]